MAFTAFNLCNPNDAYITGPFCTCYPPDISPASRTPSTTSSTYNPSRTTTTSTKPTITSTIVYPQSNSPQYQPPAAAVSLTTPSTATTGPPPPPNPTPPTTLGPSYLQPAKMCKYTYTLFTCGHGTHIWAEDIELCPTHRLLSAHGPSPFDGLECPSSVGTCEGVNDWLCDECTEVWDLEAGCEREG